MISKLAISGNYFGYIAKNLTYEEHIETGISTLKSIHEFCRNFNCYEPFYEKPKAVPKFNCFQSFGKPKDFMVNYLGLQRCLILSNKAFNVLKDFNLAPFSSYNFKFIWRKEWNDSYHIIFFHSQMIEYIDFSETIFKLPEGNLISETSFDNLLEKYQKKQIYFQKVKITKKIADYDLFGFYIIDQDLFLSERLKHALNNAKLTGFETLKPYFKIEY